MSEQLYIVKSKYLYCGIVLENGIVTETAPIVKWMKGMTMEEIQAKAPVHYEFLPVKQRTMKNEPLDLWVIYNKPADYPTKFVVRKWILDKPTDVFHTADTLEGIRKKIPLNLCNIGRQKNDDPKIVEVWI